MESLLSQSCQVALSVFIHHLKKAHFNVEALLPILPFKPMDITSLMATLHSTDSSEFPYLSSLFSEILNGHQPEQGYSLAPLSPESIFPSLAPEGDKHALWENFLQGVKEIPAAHKVQPALWLDHFDTALQCFMNTMPSSEKGVSLYDVAKTQAALVTALWQTAQKQENKEAPFLFIQGDFFGIQDFIFAEGRQTNKQAAKLLRGRSFQVSLFTELAALKILQACELPSTSQVLNAAGKFLIIAPNTASVKEAVEKVRTELNQWFITHTYGLAGIGLAMQTATLADIDAEHFSDLQKRLFLQLEKIKLQRLDLTQSTQSVQNVDYPSGTCELNAYFPALEEQTRSQLSLDQIKIGEQLAKKNSIIICDEKTPVNTQHLLGTIFGYKVIFTEKEETIEQILRFWDFSLPENLNTQIWNGYARRYINAYIPYFNGKEDHAKYKGIDEANKIEIKTFDYLAGEDRLLNEKGQYIGQTALMTLKGDVDNLGSIFQSGLKQNTLAKMTALSRQMNQFFSLWLPAYCAEHYQNIYTVFAGGDDFFLIGPWHHTQKLAFEMQKAFKRYVAENPEIHFSVGMVMTKVGVPVPRLGELAEEALEKAKGIEGKNALTIYDRSVKWEKWQPLLDLKEEIERLAKDYEISTAYIYSLIHFALQAENKENKIENSMWRSRFYYKTARYVVDKLKKEAKSTALNQIITSLGDKGIEAHKGDFIIPVFNYFYQKRN